MGGIEPPMKILKNKELGDPRKNAYWCFLNGKIFKLKKGLSSATKIVVSFNLPIIQFYHLFSCTFPNF